MSSCNKGANLINDQISYDTVRVIGKDGENVGVLSVQDAMKLANDSELDLMVIHCPEDDYPICKVLDYGKYKYKKTLKSKKNSKASKKKEIFLSMNIGDHDKQTKMKKISMLLDKNRDVIVGIKLKGRYRGMLEVAKGKLVEALKSKNISINDKNWRISRDVVSILIRP